MTSMIEDLMNPSAYSEKIKNIKFIQTHISNVFIGEKYVYKIKKPVNFGFLDFSSIKKRKYYCNREVELNSRFSKDVYLGVYPVTFDGNNHSINGEGDIVDYAVKMRRIPDKDLLKSRFNNNTVTQKDIERVAKAIADFHKESKQSEEIDDFGKLNTVKFNTDENFQQTQEFIDNSITKEQFYELKNWTDEFYNKHSNLFEKRIEAGKIRDCHGDLHMEHIVLTDPIIIFDCIEFNDRFRYSDTLSDIAFLLMDLEFNGGENFSKNLCSLYLNFADEKKDSETMDIFNYYKIYRAYVRGKVTSFILNDGNVGEDKKNNARNIAQKYFSLAHSYIR
jgi:aminoglycoside phosphotransferase family enzyme